MTTIKLLSAADLKARFKKIIPFMSTDKTRYYLCGVYFEYDNGNLKATATNGHILCTMEWGLPEQAHQLPFKVICPAHAVKALTKIITAKNVEDGGVLLSLENGVIKFEFTDFTYTTKEVKGTYPDYAKVIPQGKDRLNAGLDASYLISVLKALNHSPVDILIDDSAKTESHPHLFTSKDEDGVKCVIVPKRN